MTQDEKREKINFPMHLCTLLVGLGIMIFFVVQERWFFGRLVCGISALTILGICGMWFFLREKPDNQQELPQQKKEKKKETEKSSVA